MAKTYFIIISSIFAFSCKNNQTESKVLSKNEKHVHFELYYGFSGLGSNMGSFQPTLRAIENNFIYTYEQNSYIGERDNKADTICTGKLRQSSIDSILNLVKNLKDTLIYKTNPGIMSGGIHFMTIIWGKDSTKFELDNTFDYTALKIINIVNNYLPKEKQIWVDEKMIKLEEEYWNRLRQNIKQKTSK